MVGLVAEPFYMCWVSPALACHLPVLRIAVDKKIEEICQAKMRFFHGMDADSSCGDFSPLCLTENSRGREGKTNNEGRGHLSKTDPVLSSVKD